MGTFTHYPAAVTLPDMESQVRPIHARPIYRVRYVNFRALIGPEHGAISEAAKRLGKSQAQVSSFGGAGPTKNIGDDVAAHIEAAWNLPSGSLDIDMHSRREDSVIGSAAEANSVAGSVALDPVALAEAEKWVRFEEARRRQEYQPLIRAERLIAIHRLIVADGGALSPDHSEELIQAARDRPDQGIEDGRSKTERLRGRPV